MPEPEEQRSGLLLGVERLDEYAAGTTDDNDGDDADYATDDFNNTDDDDTNNTNDSDTKDGKG